MAKVFFRIYDQIYDSSKENQEGMPVLLYKKEKENIELNDLIMKELFLIAQSYKGDMIRYVSMITHDLCYIMSIYLMYQSDNERSSMRLKSDQIIEKCSNHIDSLTDPTRSQTNITGEQLNHSISSYTGCFLYIDFLGSSDENSYKEIINFLETEKISLKPITIEKKEYFSGSSGCIESILLFVPLAVASGFTYDSMKYLVKKILNKFHGTISLRKELCIDQSFRSVLNSVSRRINQPESNIFVLSFDENEKKYVFALKDNVHIRIYVKYNENNDITSVKTKEVHK